MQYDRPKNESETHFMLKEIAKYIMFIWGYRIVGTEVGNMWTIDSIKDKNRSRSIIDVAGAKPLKRKSGKTYDVRGIEAKASLSDFKSGFCFAPAHTHIIAPKGIIPINLLPSYIGLIEVDFDKFALPKYPKLISDIKGVTLVKKSSKHMDERFGDEKKYRQWCEDTVDSIAYRTSVELLFWRNFINFKKGR